MAGLFISYRREDSAADAGRLLENLQLCCRTDVYLDLTTPAGSDFRAVLSAKLDTCDAVLVLIGPRWLTAQDQKSGMRRLDDADDFVRFEIATTLQKGKTIIPVLLPGGTLPRAEELPQDIRELVWRQAVDIRYAHWTADVNALIAKLPRSLGCTEQSGVKLSAKSWLSLALVPILLITAVHTFAVLEVENLRPEVFSIGLSLAFGGLHTFQLKVTLGKRAAMAAAIALGVGILASTAVPLIMNQDIVPRSLIPVRLFVILVAGIFAGYLIGASAADALLRRRSPRSA